MKTEMFQNLHLQLSRDDIKRIDNWKIDNGMKSRAEAIRSMIKAASQMGQETFGKSRMLSERDNYSYFGNEVRVPAKNTKSEQPLEEIIRKLVKEEVEKAKRKN